MARETEPIAASQVLDPERRLGRIYFWLVLLGGVGQLGIVWTIDVTVNTASTHHLFAFSAGVAGAAVWWAVFARWAEREYRRMMTSQLERQQSQASRIQHALVMRLQEELRVERSLLVADQQRQEIPAALYASHDNFDLRFTRDLTRDLEISSVYLFRGPTAVFVPARLMLRDPSHVSLKQVLVKMIDPRSPFALEQAIKDRRRKLVHEAKDDETIRSEILSDIAMAVVGLFDARDTAREIRIAYEPRAVIHRTELFDDAVYDARIAVPGNENFPSGARWASDQAWYRRISDELFADVDPLPGVLFTAVTPDSALTSHLESLDLASTDVGAVRENYGNTYVASLRDVIQRARAFTEEYSPDVT